MKCDFDYCIYNKSLNCGLEEIRINALGMCDECIIVLIPEEELELLKETQIQQ